MEPAEIFQQNSVGGLRLSKRLTSVQIDDELYNKSREIGRRCRNVGVNTLVNLVRPCERDLYDMALTFGSLLDIIEENEPKLRQDIQHLKEKLEEQRQKNIKLEKQNYQLTNQLREIKEENQNLNALLKSTRQRTKQLIDDQMYRADVAHMHKKIAMEEVERVKECFDCCSPYKYSSQYNGRGHVHGSGYGNSHVFNSTQQSLNQSSVTNQQTRQEDKSRGPSGADQLGYGQQQQTRPVQDSIKQPNSVHFAANVQPQQQVAYNQQPQQVASKPQLMQYQDNTQQLIQQNQSQLQKSFGVQSNLALSAANQTINPQQVVYQQQVIPQQHAVQQQPVYIVQPGPAMIVAQNQLQPQVQPQYQQPIVQMPQQQVVQAPPPIQQQTQNVQPPQGIQQPQQTQAQEYRAPVVPEMQQQQYTNMVDEELENKYKMLQDLIYSKKQFEMERDQNNMEIAREYARLSQERRLAAMELAKISEEREKLERSQTKLDNMAMALSAAGVPIDM